MSIESAWQAKRRGLPTRFDYSTIRVRFIKKIVTQ